MALLFTYLLHSQGMQMIFLMLFLIFKLKDPKLADNLTYLMYTPKIVGLCNAHQANQRFFFFFNEGEKKYIFVCYLGKK